MGTYSQFKRRVLETNLSLVGIGTGLAWTFAGEGAALDFACGGAGGLIYMSLLQHGADALPLSSTRLDSQVQTSTFHSGEDRHAADAEVKEKALSKAWNPCDPVSTRLECVSIENHGAVE